MRSIIRDLWEILDAEDQPIGKLEEDSGGMAVARRFLSNLIPQRFFLTAADGTPQASFRQHFNPFVYRLQVDIAPSATIDRRMILGVAVLAAAIEGRQG